MAGQSDWDAAVPQSDWDAAATADANPKKWAENRSNFVQNVGETAFDSLKALGSIVSGVADPIDSGFTAVKNTLTTDKYKNNSLKGRLQRNYWDRQSTIDREREDANARSPIAYPVTQVGGSFLLPNPEGIYGKIAMGVALSPEDPIAGVAGTVGGAKVGEKVVEGGKKVAKFLSRGGGRHTTEKLGPKIQEILEQADAHPEAAGHLAREQLAQNIENNVSKPLAMDNPMSDPALNMLRRTTKNIRTPRKEAGMEPIAYVPRKVQAEGRLEQGKTYIDKNSRVVAGGTPDSIPGDTTPMVYPKEQADIDHALAEAVLGPGYRKRYHIVDDASEAANAGPGTSPMGGNVDPTRARNAAGITPDAPRPQGKEVVTWDEIKANYMQKMDADATFNNPNMQPEYAPLAPTQLAKMKRNMDNEINYSTEGKKLGNESKKQLRREYKDAELGSVERGAPDRFDEFVELKKDFGPAAGAEDWAKHYRNAPLSGHDVAGYGLVKRFGPQLLTDAAHGASVTTGAVSKAVGNRMQGVGGAMTPEMVKFLMSLGIDPEEIK